MPRFLESCLIKSVVFMYSSYLLWLEEIKIQTTDVEIIVKKPVFDGYNIDFFINIVMSDYKLLSIIELGGYPDFADLYKTKGFQVDTATSMRKAIKVLKNVKPDIIVAEFNFQSDFRDRTSSLESLMAAIQGFPDIHVVVFYEKDQRSQLDRLLSVHDVFEIIPFPVDRAVMNSVLDKVIAEIAKI